MPLIILNNHRMSNLTFLFHRMRYEYSLSYLMSSLRNHYGDICSNGDLEIHRILNRLESGSNISVVKDEHIHISNTLLHWWNLGDCHPDIRHAL